MRGITPCTVSSSGSSKRTTMATHMSRGGSTGRYKRFLECTHMTSTMERPCNPQINLWADWSREDFQWEKRGVVDSHRINQQLVQKYSNGLLKTTSPILELQHQAREECRRERETHGRPVDPHRRNTTMLQVAIRVMMRKIF